MSPSQDSIQPEAAAAPDTESRDQQPEDIKMTSPPARRTRPARNAANKASAKMSAVAAREASPDGAGDPAADLLSEALTTNMSSNQDDWKAWVEIESEPAFFNGLLRDLGVKDVKVAEMFTVSEEDIALLPQPILGFVFLCRYANEDQEAAPADAPPELWFANQTMANGCATVALLNILMNQPAVDLGPGLSAFRRRTAALSPPLRGYLLDSDEPVRRVHNSFARCLEHLNADLLLSNEYDDCGGWPEEEPAKKPAKKRKASASSRKKRKHDDDACHYKAFVFVAGQVWVLDGLETAPVPLGPAAPETWVSVALRGIADRMAVAGDMVNIMAVCASPRAALRRELLANVRTQAALHASQPAGLDLARFGLTPEDLEAAEPDRDVVDRARDPDAARAALEVLRVEQMRIVSEYRQADEEIAHEEALCGGRKRHYGGVVHMWAKKIAERGGLQGLLGS